MRSLRRAARPAEVGPGLRRHVRDVRTSNGLRVSPDGKHLYFADSSTRTLWVYELAEPEESIRKCGVSVTNAGNRQ